MKQAMRKRRPVGSGVILFGLLFLLVGGCDFAPRSDIAELRQELSEAKAKLSELDLVGGCDFAPRSDIAELRQELSEAKAKLSELDLVGGCDFAPRSDIAELRQELSEAKAKLSELELKLSVQQFFTARLMRDQFSSASFDPAANEGFSRLDTSVGSLAVSLQEVSPYADGVKLRFHVGNLTAATINGATFKVKWGPRMPEPTSEDFVARYGEWQKALREKEIKVTNTLKSGTWNNVSITLPATKFDELGHVELSMQTSQISLYLDR